MTAARGLRPWLVGVVRTRIGGETKTGFPHLGPPKFVGKMRAIGDRCASFALGVERGSSSTAFSSPETQGLVSHRARIEFTAILKPTPAWWCSRLPLIPLAADVKGFSTKRNSMD